MKLVALSIFSLLVAVGLSKPFCVDDDLYKSLDEAAKAKAPVSLLVAAIDYVGLSDVVANAQNITILAPNDEAFAQLVGSYNTAGLASMNPEWLATVLLNHIIVGKVYSTDLPKGGATIPTLLNTTYIDNKKVVCESPVGVLKYQNLTFTSTALYNATLVDVKKQADLKICDAVVHIINTVLVPSCQVPKNGMKATNATVAAGVRALGLIKNASPPLVDSLNVTGAYQEANPDAPVEAPKEALKTVVAAVKQQSPIPAVAPAVADVVDLREVENQIVALAPAPSGLAPGSEGMINGAPTPAAGPAIPTESLNSNRGFAVDVATPPEGAFAPADVQELVTAEGWANTTDKEAGDVQRACFNRTDLATSLDSLSSVGKDNPDISAFIKLLQANKELLDELQKNLKEATLFVPINEAFSLKQLLKSGILKKNPEQVLKYHVATQLLANPEKKSTTIELPTLVDDKTCDSTLQVDVTDGKISSIDGNITLADETPFLSCDQAIAVYIINGILDPGCGLPQVTRDVPPPSSKAPSGGDNATAPAPGEAASNGYSSAAGLVFTALFTLLASLLM